MAALHHPSCAARYDDDAVCGCLANPIDSVMLSGHARQRAAEMGVSLNDVLLTVAEPEVRYEQTRRGPGCWLYQRGHLAVAVRTTSTCLVALSVLPRVGEVYGR